LLAFELPYTEHSWNHFTEPTGRASLAFKGGRSFWPHGKMLGGSSSMNAMLYVRGNNRDYDQWEAMGNPGWGWKDVLEYFKKSEGNGADHVVQEKPKHHNSDGLLKVNSYFSTEMMKIVILEAASELGYREQLDVNSDTYVGFVQLQGTLDKGRRYSTAKAFLNTAKERSNLHVIKNAYVKKINFDADKRATSVTFDVKDQKDLVASAKKEVVLSAGAIQSPQVLKLSGIGPESELRDLNIQVVKNLPVGENLQDHLIVPMFFSKKTNNNFNLQDMADALYAYMRHQVGPFASLGMTDLSGFVDTVNPSGKYPDIQYLHFLVQSRMPNCRQVLEKFAIDDPFVDQLVAENQDSDIVLVFATLLNPKSSGRIQLRGADPHDSPKIHANYLDDERDVLTLTRGIDLYRKFLTTETFKLHKMKDLRLKIDECDAFDYETEEYWGCYIRYFSTTLYHPAGTAKMGPASDPEAVVDPQLKVHGVKGLRVIDASVMPKIVSGNTNAPVIMIAEKASDMIKQDWRGESHREEL
jgi:choline dehydrogenase-like flavoprotein